VESNNNGYKKAGRKIDFCALLCVKKNQLIF